MPLHVVQRGNNRQRCFFDQRDRSFYLHHLARLARIERCAVHAYCLMTNHVHLLITAAEAHGCARLMKRLGMLHTQYVNRAYQRSGTLWEGRFRSCVVQSEDYLLACYRYIESNPLRAGIVADPGDYSWSSYRTNANGADDAVITPHDEYLRLGEAGNQRQSAYRALFHLSIPGTFDDIREATNGNFALGTKAFKLDVAAALGKRVERGKPGRPRSAVSAGQLDLLAVEGKTWSVPD